MTDLKNNFLYIIPCRAGSQRVKNKNFKEFGRSNLTQIAIDTILGSNESKENIIISSDSNIAKEIAMKNEVFYHRRSKNLASNDAKTNSLVKDLFENFNILNKYKYIVLIQPTSPLRDTLDIRKSRELIINENKNSLITITKCTFSNPDYLYELSDGKLNKIIEDFRYLKYDPEKLFFRNGAIYITHTNYFLKNNDFIDPNSLCFYKMPLIRSINIDTNDDWEIAEELYNSRNKIL